MPDIYEIVGSPIHHCHCGCELKINWNISAISGSQKASGYILQHFTRKLEPFNVLKTDEYNDISYFEAWKAVGGAISIDDKGSVCDDMFCIGNSYTLFDDFTRSLGTKGSFSFYGDVYWIPYDSKLYRIINTWKKDEIKQSAGLRATYDFIDIGEEYRHFVREPFIHSWDLTDEETIYEQAKIILFRYCPNSTERDYNLLKTNATDLFTKEYSFMTDRIIKEWEEIHFPLNH